MARSKSIPGSKPTSNKEQTVAGDGINSLDVKSTPKEMPPQESRQGSTPEPQARLAAESNATKQVKAEPRKLEVVKNESRKNLVPINLEDEIRRLAYLLSERRGFEPGHDAEDWLAAEREVRQRYHQQSA